MKRFYVVLVVLCLALALPVAAGEVKDALMELQQKFTSGAAKGDAAMMASIYTDDAVLMPPNMPVVKGRDAIQQFWGGMLQGGPVEIVLTTESITFHGDLAVERGHFEVKAPMKDSGKFVLVFRKQNGKWLAVSDIWNANEAPMAPATTAGTQ